MNDQNKYRRLNDELMTEKPTPSPLKPTEFAPFTPPARSEDDMNTKDREVLYEYAMEERAPDPSLLREYITKYPWLQTELEDLHISMSKEKYGRPE